MDVRSKRKDRLSEYTIKQYGVNAVMIAALFLFGLVLSWDLSAFAGLLYLLAWVASYIVIHATTCRNCEYYGKQCPLPFEGGCSHVMFDQGKNFGIIAGLGGLLAYFMRVCIPYVAILQAGSFLYFTLYTGVIVLFCYVLFYHTGCPHCIQTKCPMNPDFHTQKPNR
jgi:hypothetical protein